MLRYMHAPLHLNQKSALNSDFSAEVSQNSDSLTLLSSCDPEG